MRKIHKTFLLTALAALCAPSIAHAQFSPDSKAPITGSADNVTNSPGVTILSGQVDVRQADVRILADTMKIYNAANGGAAQSGAFDNVDRIEAIGNFYYITPEQEVKGKRGVYEQATDTFTVYGDVILLQGEDNVVTGSKLIYDLTTREARVIGSCQGRRCGSSGRVNILIKNTGGSATQPAS